jgi:hypothetical protein
MEAKPDTPEGKSLRSANYLANHMGQAPVLIFCCVKRYNDERRAGQPMVGSIYPAVQNLCLAARAYGLGTSITAMHAGLSEGTLGPSGAKAGGGRDFF